MSKLPTGVIARGGRLYVRYRDPTTGKWRTDATGLPLSEVKEAVRIRDTKLGKIAPVEAPRRPVPAQKDERRHAPQGELPAAKPADHGPWDEEIAQAIAAVRSPPMHPGNIRPLAVTRYSVPAPKPTVTAVPVTAVTTRGVGNVLRITVELQPSWGGPSKTIGTMTVTNDGTGTLASGNYDVVLNATHRRIEGFPRLESGAWDLVYRALGEIMETERKKRGRG